MSHLQARNILVYKYWLFKFRPCKMLRVVGW